MEKNKFKELKNKKGFTIALYSCAAIVIAMTGIIASKNESAKQEKQNTTQVQQVEQVNQSNVKSYQDNKKQEKNKNLTAKNETTTQNQNVTSEKKKDSVAPTTETPAKSEKTTQTTLSYDETKEMKWPVSGQIVMDYSTETAIYDKTLDQYRTNDNICISGKVGDDVYASTKGIVKSVSKDKENLTTIILDHGNGWLSTYSQLQDNTLVKKGDIVDEGAVIGNISEPSYKSSLLGPHLEFKITHNNTSTDPKLLLAQEE